MSDATTYIPKPQPCSECGRTDWIVSVVTTYGARFCRSCWKNRGGK